MDDSPDWVALLLVILEDGLNIGSVLQVTWEDLDDGILAILLRSAGWKLIEGDL